MNADELKDWLVSQQQKWKHKAETLGKDNIAYIDIRNCQWAYNFVLEELENDMNNTTEEITTLKSGIIDNLDGSIINQIIPKNVVIEELEEFKKYAANSYTTIEGLEKFKKETANDFIITNNNISTTHHSLLNRIESTNEFLQAELKNIRLKLNIGFAAFVLLNLGIIIYLIQKV
jgi:hypothetical protein